MASLFGGGQSISQAEPAIGALRVQTSSYGMAVPLVYGTNRISCNLIWYGDFTAIAHTSTQSAGGKGGGGATYSNTTYTYKVAAALGLSEGQITGIGAMWRGKTKYANPAADLGFSVFQGGYAQSPWGHLTTNHTGEALNYRGQSYIANASYDLGSSASLPNHSVELKGLSLYGGTGPDANPKDVITDCLSNAKYGVGFPAAKIDTLTTFDAYCRAYGLFISPAWTQQRAAHEMVTEILDALGAEPFWSEGKIKILPYADEARTANGATYTPNLTPAYDLTDDDFLYKEGEDPVICEPKGTAELYNQVRFEINNRANDYNVEPCEAKDQANIDLYGLRPMNTVKAAFICDKDTGQQCTQMKLQRVLYVGKMYRFRLGWRFARLEPMDLLTITDAGLHLDQVPVLIAEIEEDEEGGLTVLAEEYPYGVNSGAQYPQQGTAGYVTDYNADPGNVNAPLIFEPPMALAQAPEVWMAISGGASWGGCEIWISADNATYARVGTINGGARMGVLSAALAAGSNPDITNTLSLNLSQSRGQLLSGTQQDADDLVTLCYVDGELMAYQTATLTSQYNYDLTYLVRGAYATVNAAHNSGTKFARLDQGLFKYGYTPDQIGKTIYFKFLSFNAYQGGLQALADVSAYTYTIAGAPVGQVTGLALEQPFTGTSLKVKWSPVSQADSYTVEVWADSALRRTVTGIAAPRFEYTAEDAKADGGPWRSITTKVKAVSANGSSTNFAELVSSNPAPATPAGLSATGGPNNITVKANKPADTDYVGTLIYMDTTTGFTPGPTNLVYDGPDVQVTIAGLSQVPYYIRVAHYDSYGTSALNLSTEISATPTSITGTIGVVASLPALGDYEGQVVYLSTNDKLYRWDGAAWTAAVDGADIVAASVTAQKLSVASLSAIAASLGSITSGNITLDATSSIKGGQTAYNTGTGFWMGYDAGAYKFSFGSAGQSITWDGSQLSLGALSVAGALTVGTTGNLKGGQTAYDTGSGFFLGYSGGAYKFSIGNSAGNKLTWDGTNLGLTGQIIQTGNIVNGAVSNVINAYTDADVSVTGTGDTTIQSAAITTTGQKVLILFMARAPYSITNGIYNLKVYRDTTLLWDAKVVYASNTFYLHTDSNSLPTISLSDSPGAGTYTYKVTCDKPVGGTTVFFRRSLTLQEIKK